MKTFLESELANRFSIKFLNTNVRKNNADKGRLDFSMISAFFIFTWRLIHAVIKHRPGAAYYFVTATKVGWLGRDIWCIFICRLLRTPIILHMRAGHFKRNFDHMREIEKKVIKLACGKAAIGLVQAEKLRNQFDNLIPKNRIHVLYNAVDTSKYFNPQPVLYNPLKILFLGHLSFAKGYCDLLKVIPVIAHKHPDIRFIFAGNFINYERNVFFNESSGEEIAFEDPCQCYDTHIRGKFDVNYDYLGAIGEKEKLEILKECNFLVLPSYSEGFSMAVLEAISMAKPVVCSTVGALGEVVHDKENGLLIQPGDLKGLSTNIDELIINQKLRNAIALRNHDYARETFDSNIIAYKLGDHIQAVISNK